jgi:hypothetical protein
MKKASQKQISEAKAIKTYFPDNFHGNRQKVGSLWMNDYKLILKKKRERQDRARNYTKPTPAQLARKLLAYAKEYKKTPYFKTMIEGRTGIYLASPEYGHKDYNKSRLFDKTPRNIQIMEIFNKLITR